MNPVIRSAGVWGHPNIRTWQPDDPDTFAVTLMLDIGEKGKKSADTFTLRVATPSGLDQLDEHEGILASRPLLVMRSYDFDELWGWLQTTVAGCEADSWLGCVEKLRLHFDWEYDGYEEH